MFVDDFAGNFWVRGLHSPRLRYVVILMIFVVKVLLIMSPRLTKVVPVLGKPVVPSREVSCKSRATLCLSQILKSGYVTLVLTI